MLASNGTALLAVGCQCISLDVVVWKLLYSVSHLADIFYGFNGFGGLRSRNVAQWGCLGPFRFAEMWVKRFAVLCQAVLIWCLYVGIACSV